MKPSLHCLLALLALSAQSLFAQVTVTITGTILEATTGGVPTPGPFMSAFPVGTAFTATFTYDPATVDTWSLPTPDRAYYQNNLAVSTAVYSAGGYNFSAIGVGSAIEVFNNDSSYYGAPIDGLSFSFSGDASVQAGGYRPTSFNFRMLDDNLSLFGNDSLANITFTTWALGDFQSVQPSVSVGFIGGYNLFGYASSFSFSTAAIPEPSTYAAFAGLGALCLACWRRRRARDVAPGLSRS